MGGLKIPPEFFIKTKFTNLHRKKTAYYYLLMSDKNSLRVSRSSRKTPPNADVTV